MGEGLLTNDRQEHRGGGLQRLIILRTIVTIYYKKILFLTCLLVLVCVWVLKRSIKNDDVTQ